MDKNSNKSTNSNINVGDVVLVVTNYSIERKTRYTYFTKIPCIATITAKDTSTAEYFAPLHIRQYDGAIIQIGFYSQVVKLEGWLADYMKAFHE